MKKLSKIVALLLAGALTMLLFTACGAAVAAAALVKECRRMKRKPLRTS